MIGSSGEIIVFSLYFLLVPGFPFAFLFGRRSQNWALVLAVSPLLSIGLNYLFFSIVNFLGLKIDLKYLGFTLVFMTIALLGLYVQPKWNELVSWGTSLIKNAPASIIGIFVWTKAYEGFLFLAPNHDALNHNKWIARIIQTDSVLLSDSYVSSPLQGLGKGTGFYPMAWHSLVAVGADISKVAVPAASLLSVLIIWVFVLPSALSALAKLWIPELYSLGLIAGILVQMYPLTPGMPLSWGSMTSAVGIGLLPSAFCVGVLALNNLDKFWIASLIFTSISLFFIHTPEAASLFVLMVGLTATQRTAVTRNFKILIAGVFTVIAIPGLIIFRKTIFDDRDSIRSLFGAVQPIWEKVIGQFFTLNVNLPSSYFLISLLFIIGLVWGSYQANQRWLINGVLGLGFIYLLSGASVSPLSNLRFLTAPWYASFERTLWLVVPFAALVSALPIAKLLERRNGKSVVNYLLLPACGLFLFSQIVKEQIPATVNQMRSGPEISALLEKDDLRVIEESKNFITKGQIAISWFDTGSTYPFMYEQIPVTAGVVLGSSGEVSQGIQDIYTNIANLCSSEVAKQALVAEKVAVVYFGTTAAWGSSVWTESEVRRLSGLKLVLIGEKLMVSIPDLASCT